MRSALKLRTELQLCSGVLITIGTETLQGAVLHVQTVNIVDVWYSDKFAFASVKFILD